jgi:Ca2+/Na+ antiporter
MRKLFLILSFIFTGLSVLFSVLPLDTLAFIPIGLAVICLVITFLKSEIRLRVWPKRLFIITYLCIAVVLVKTFFFKDEVAVDQQFEQQKIETKQEAKKELEELEGLE